MKKILFLFAAFLMIDKVNAQVVKRVFDKKTKNEYYVLKSDKTIKQGPYKNYYFKEIDEEGYYLNNLKDSICKEYFSGKLLAEGNYKQGKKVGIWKFYKEEKLVQEFDFTNNVLVSNQLVLDVAKEKNTKSFKYALANTSDTNKVTLDMPLVMIGGIDGLNRILFNNLIYPDKAREKGISGKVQLQFVIDENGNTSKFEIPNKIGNGFDEAVLNLVSYFAELKWIPAKVNNKAVAIIYNIPINFVLSE